MEQVQAKDICQGLRGLADFIEDNAALLVDDVRMFDKVTLDLISFGFDEAKEKAFLVDVARAGTKKGTVAKEYTGHFAKVIVPFGKQVALVANASRELVCTKKVVGHRVVERKDPTEWEITQVTEDIVEWECAPLMKD